MSGSARDDVITRMLDPRWQWIFSTIWRLYGELEPGDAPVGITLAVRSQGQYVSYGMTPLDSDVQRHVVVNPTGAADAIRDHLLDVTPDSEVTP